MEKLKFAWRARWPAKPALALAAAVLSLALHAGLLALFDSAAPGRWLPASPVLDAALASCRAHAGRALRERCAHEVVAAARGASAVRLADARR